MEELKIENEKLFLKIEFFLLLFQPTKAAPKAISHP
jgi:hypothetical protein